MLLEVTIIYQVYWQKLAKEWNVLFIIYNVVSERVRGGLKR